LNGLEKIVHSWSGGKDSSIALYEIINSGIYEPVRLLTTATLDYGRVSMHGVRIELALKQSNSIGIPLDIVYLSKEATNEEYESRMKEKLLQYKAAGIEKVSFGDIFLEDIRKYRESRMAQLNMNCIFPIWGRDTRKLSKEIIRLGFRAIVCTVDSRKLGKKFTGMEYDEDFLAMLPDGIDPCGENGEFHTFVFDGPIFRRQVKFRKGKTVLRGSFYFTDLIPED
jgi:uncharacterized protein (TIGR00290 family)